MSVMWVLLVAATGASPANSNQPAATSTSTAPAAAAVATAEPAARSAKELRQAVADGLRRANSAKPADREAAISGLVELFNELGNDHQLSAPERQRLGVELRSRLLRFASQFRHELARSAQRTSPSTETGAGGGSAVENLDELVDLIQKTIGPQDWVLAQRVGGPGAAGQGGAGLAGQGANGAGANGAGGLDQQAEANGQALVDLIQTTIAPDTWDVRGGPGTIMYYNPLRALVIRQTGDVHDDLNDLLNGLRK